MHLLNAVQDPRLKYALMAEFLGTALFQLLSGTAGNRPLEVAFAFAAIMYAMQFISGGHLNPSVSLSAAGSGHIDWTRGATYLMAQFLGALLGAMLQVGLVPGSAFGKLNAACLHPARHVNAGMLFGWEFLLTFFFVHVMYTCIFVPPGYGRMGPLAAGLALFAALGTGGQYTGGSPLNPARVLASAIVFKCYWRWAWVYLLAEGAAVACAALWSIGLFGKGMYYGGVRPDEHRRGRGAAEHLMSEPGPLDPAGIARSYEPLG